MRVRGQYNGWTAIRMSQPMSRYRPVETTGWDILFKHLQRHPGHGKTPDEPKQRPAPRATQHTQRERRVGSGDEKKDRGVLDDPKHTLGPAVGRA